MPRNLKEGLSSMRDLCWLCVVRRKCLMCFVNELLRESATFSSLAVLKYTRINSFQWWWGYDPALLPCYSLICGQAMRELFWALTSPKSSRKKYWLEYDVIETFINPSPTLALRTEEFISPKSVRLLNFSFLNIKIIVKFYSD